ncbi:MAG: B12-binding domain-containing radical SAM protein [Candidatus Omnitrophica bacterium]|nr:B12-binding domain-containing radical SAM protein [Candidatus Omnitrophota bacterium]
MKFGLLFATKQMEHRDYNQFPTAGIGYLAGMIKRELPQVDVVMSQSLDSLMREQPDMIGISATTPNYHVAIDWALTIKQELKIPVIIGGIHITLLPSSIEPCFDLAILGEGEHTIVEVLQSFLSNNNLLNYSELAEIKGLFYIQEGKPVMTEPRELIEDLDSLPVLAYESLPYYQEGTAGCIVASRGCPYKCSFCASEKMFQKYRLFTVGRIIREIRYLVARGKEDICFYDDLLIADTKRFERLVFAIEAEGLNKKCRFSCNTRPNCITRKVCKLFKRMNVTTVGIGVESFCDKMLLYYNKTAVTAKICQKAIDLLHEHGILVNPGIIFGGPPETREDMLITLRKIFINIRDKKICNPCFSLLVPYPGTRIWEHAEKKGLVSTHMDFSKFSDWSNFELYLGEQVSQREFVVLIEEWKTKITLLYHRKGLAVPEGQFTIPDQASLQKHLVWVSKLINDPQRKPELGDDLVSAAVAENNRIFAGQK